MAILRKSCGLFSRGTVCYCIQDKSGREYALKDCWVDADVLSHEESLLNAVKDVPNIIQLVRCWDVQYDRHTNCTLNIRDHVCDHLPASPIFINKVHHRMLLTPCGLPLTTFKSLPEILNVFLDLVIAHKTMVGDRKVLHGDLSPNNLITHEGKGYFIDFDHAKFIVEKQKAKDSRGTGTIPYISCRLLRLMGGVPSLDLIDHRPCDNLESLFYIFLKFTIIYVGPGGSITDRGMLPVNSGSLKREFLMENNPSFEPSLFFQACHPILEEWHQAIGDALKGERDLSHDEIGDIIKWGLNKLDSFPSPKIPRPIMKSLSSKSDSPSVFTPSPPIAMQLPRHST
ncbi:hypothetical protein BDR05DRAFT_1004371 [Suillus weaverae]|nr:hypothetical protein BDR05DRAFT_1004371 [Suillus weaverae]